MTKFIDSLMAPVYNEDKTDPYSNYQDIGYARLLELVGDSRMKGVPIKNIKDKEKRKAALEQAVLSIMERSEEICKAVSVIGGDFQDKVADKLGDQTAAVSDVLFGLQCGVFDPDGQHTTIVKLPKRKMTGENALCMMHGFIEDAFARLYDIKDPVELHELVYNALILMAVVEARANARANMKNTDRAGLLENPLVGELLKTDGALMCDFFKDKNFWEYKITGNPHIEELSKARKKEDIKLQKVGDMVEGDIDVDW